MIAPGIRMHGFASPSFPRLAELASRRDLGGEREIHVLHEDGRVLTVVDTTLGRIAVGDQESPLDLGRRLAAERGAARLVVADRRQLRDSIADAESQVGRDTPQPEAMLALQQAFRDSPGVICEPPLPDLDGWRQLRDRMAAAPDGAVVLAAGDSGDWPIALLGHLVDGLLTELTDLPPEAVTALPDLGDVAAAIGSDIALALITSARELERILLAPDLPAALLAALETPHDRTTRGHAHPRAARGLRP